MTSRSLLPKFLILAALLPVVGFVAWRLLNTSFMLYDDEGYMLIGLANFSKGHPLYDEVFTQYGPAPFLYHWLASISLGVPVDHALGRLLTWTHWLTAALASGLLAWRLSGRFWTAPFTIILSFGYLWQITSEPSHPGGFITAVISTACLLAVHAWTAAKRRTALAVLGGAGAVLLLTKINIGVLWLAAAVVFWSFASDHVLARKSRWALAIAYIAMPFILMRPLLNIEWVLYLALVFAISAALLIVIMHLALRDDRPAASACLSPLPLIFTGLAVAAGIIALTLARGTSTAGLLEGVLIAPLRHAVNFNFGFNWLPHAFVIGAGCIILSIAWLVFPLRRPALDWLIVLGRLTALCVLAWHAQLWLSIYGVGRVIAYSLPLTLLFVLPLSKPSTGQRLGLPIATLLAFAQVLHTYPVAGSQMGWGTFLLLPIWVTGLADAADWLRSRVWRFSPAAVAIIALSISAYQFHILYREAVSRWTDYIPLRLPGSTELHISASTHALISVLTTNSKVHADVLFSRPGMFSFNLWTGIPTPTMRNATHWFWLLSEKERSEIAMSMSSAPQAAIIVSKALDQFVEKNLGLKMQGGLNDIIAKDYPVLFNLNQFEFRLRSTKPAVPFNLYECYLAKESSPPSRQPLMVEINLAIDDTVEKIHLLHCNLESDAPLVLSAANSTLATVTPITSGGYSIGPEVSVSWPLRLTGLTRLRLWPTQGVPDTLSRDGMFLYDTKGGLITSATRAQSEPAALAHD